MLSTIVNFDNIEPHSLPEAKLLPGLKKLENMPVARNTVPAHQSLRESIKLRKDAQLMTD